MAKKIVAVLVGLLVVIILVLGVITLRLDKVIKTSVETLGPKFTGVSVKLDKVSLSLLNGELKLAGLMIGNPQGFSTPSAMTLGNFEAKLAVGSLFSDKIIVERVLIQAPEITFEGSLQGSNLSKLLEQIQGGQAKAEPAEKPAPQESPAEEQKPAKKVVIKDFLIENAQVNLSMAGLGGNAVPLPLPAIHLTNIGEDTDGATIPQVVVTVFGAIVSSVTSVVSGAADLVGKGAQAAAGAAVDGVNAGANVVGDTASQGANAAIKGASKVVSGFNNLLGGDKKE